MPVKTSPSSLTIFPNRYLSFKGPIDTTLVSYAALINDTNKVFAFKVNLPKEKLSASPSSGLIGPNKTISVKVTMGALKPGERRRPHTIQFQTIEQSSEDVKLYDLVSSRIDPEKITSYELSVSHVDENGNKDDGTGSVGSTSKESLRNSPPSACNGKEDSAIDVSDEQLSPVVNKIADVNETTADIDEVKGSVDSNEDWKPSSTTSRIPKFIGFKHNLQTESPPPGFNSALVAICHREIDQSNSFKLWTNSTPKFDHVDSGVRCTPFNPTNLKKKDSNTELKTSEPVASVTDLQAGVEDHQAAAKAKEKLDDKVCAGMYGAIAKQRLQNRLGRTKSLDQALNNAKLIRSSKFHDADLWRITNNDETPSFTTDSQNVSDLGLVDSSQAKGSDLTRILDELHLNVEKQVVQVLKPALTLEDPVEVEKDHGVVPENILEGGLVKETTNCQTQMCSNEPSTTFTVQEADGASRINHQHVLGRDIDPQINHQLVLGRDIDPQPDPNEVFMRMRRDEDEARREAIFYAVGFFILGLLLGKLGF